MKKFKTAYKKLNADQKKAVNFLPGPIMVIAGPGTGKTQVLALRIANIILKKKALPEEILALTFSESAASSMRNRIIELLGSPAYAIEIKTFHSFCKSIIEENPEEFQRSQNLSNIDDLRKVRIIKSILEKNRFKRLKPFWDPFFYQDAIIRKIEELKREGITLEEFQELLILYKGKLTESKKINPRTGKPTQEWESQLKDYEKLKDLHRIYQSYSQILEKENEYDYTDMILWSTEKLKSSKSLREKYRRQYKYILSDEYQDTNIPQNEVITILGKPTNNPNIFTVGDDDQSIYGFQGATLKNILEFKKNYPLAKIISITVNYRSSPEIVSVSEKLIEQNKARITNLLKGVVTKNMKASSSGGNGGLKLAEFSNGEVENYFIAQKIKELEKKGIPKKEMAVILRTNNEVSEMAEYLIKAGIPVEMSQVGSVLEKQEILEIISILKAVRNPLNNVAVYSSLSRAVWEIHPHDFLVFTSRAAKERVTYCDFYRKSLEGNKTKKGKWQDYSKLSTFFETLIKLHKKSINSPAILLLENFLNDGGVIKKCLKEKNIRSLNRIASFFSYVKDRNRKDPNYKLKNLLEDIEVMRTNKIKLKERELSMAENDVRVMTAHKAKGKEFKAVFIPHLFRGCWDGRIQRELIKIPWHLISDSNKRQDRALQEEDERRLFFVALTRTKEILYLSRAESYNVFGDLREKPPSKFLLEIKDNFEKNKNVKLYEDAVFQRAEIELKKIKKSPIRKDEENSFLKEKVKKLALSPTSLNLYLNCPLKYKYQKLLKVPAVKNKTLILGTGIHKALEDFYAVFMKTDKLEKKVLLESFHESLEQEFFSKKELEEIEREGKKLLEDYFNNYQGKFIKPLALETGFNEVYFKGVLLTGKVDKIESLSLGKGVKVIDYKTGRAHSRNSIMGRVQSSNGDIYRQLVFYKLLSLMDNKFPYLVEESEVDFIKPERGKFKQESFQITAKEVEILKKQIEKVISKIKNLDFKPTNDQRRCQQCEFLDICKKQ